MDNIIFDDGIEEREDEGTVEDDMISSEEEGFLRGYEEEEEVLTCEECGVAIHGTPCVKVIAGETHRFCSEECAEEFAESIV